MNHSSSKNQKTDQFRDNHSNLFVNYYYKQYESAQRLITNNIHFTKNSEKSSKVNIAFFRILHASPDTPLINIKIDGTNLNINLEFKDSTQYFPINVGNHLIEAITLDAGSKSIDTQPMYFEFNNYYTIVVSGKFDDAILTVFLDNLFVPLGETKIRFVHLSPDTENLDLAVKKGEGDVVFSNISFNGCSEYLPLTPMTVNLEIRLSGTPTILFPLYKSKFVENKIYNLVAVGLQKGSPKFDIIVIN